MSIRIVLVDDHIVMRDGLRSWLEQEINLQVVGVAENGREALPLIETLHPDIVIMDIAMPGLNGIDTTKLLRRQMPDVRVIALTMHSDPQYIAGMLEAGATAYLLKSTPGRDLIEAIRKVHDGWVVLSPDLQQGAPDCNAASATGVSASVLLTERELDILRGIAEGLSPGRIAERYQVSISTVSTHRRHVMEKLGLYTTAALTKYAIRDGLTTVRKKRLSTREREVLQLLAEGKTNGEIAEILHLESNTVMKHRQKLMEKLQLDNIADLTKYAIREGLTSLE